MLRKRVRGAGESVLRVLVIVAVVAGGIALAGWTDSLLSVSSPRRVGIEDWLWVRWGVSVLIAVGLALAFHRVVEWRWPRRRALAVAPLVIVVLVAFGRPAWAGATDALADPQPVPHADLTAVTRLDVLVAARRIAPTIDGPPPPLDRTDWDTRWSVALLDATSVRVILNAAQERESVLAALTGGRDDRGSQVAWRRGARHLLLLDPYPSPAVVAGGGIAPPRGKAPAGPDRFAARAVARAPSDSHVFVLLRRNASNDVRARWQAWAERRRGGVLVVGTHGAETLADVGWRAAVVAPEDEDDVALAWRFRPRLLFDLEAKTRELDGHMPVNVDEFIATRRPRMCRPVGRGESCKRIARADEIDGSYDFLDTGATERDPTGQPMPGPPLAPGSVAPPVVSGDSCQGLPAGIPPPPTCARQAPLYWYVRRNAADIYVGYWWFFPFNPTPVFRRSTCRPLAGVPDRACFDHASDWEGITVVARPDERGDVSPTAVIYEQHGKMVRRSWDSLGEVWGGRLGDERPLVFVAAGSHASYPEACSAQVCFQAPLHPNRPEGPYGGEEPWQNNGDEVCQWTCLQRLPVTAEREAALWNAFPGVWGRRVCIWWDAVCTQTTAPRSPGFTDRFLRPWDRLHR